MNATASRGPDWEAWASGRRRAGWDREAPYYRAYGAVLQSALPFSGLPDHPHADGADVTIHPAASDWFAAALSGLRRARDTWSEHVRCGDGSDFVRWPNLFEFMVSPDGRRIACRVDETTHESFQAYLLSQVLSFALVKQGLEPLHATTVVLDGEAVAFLGESGEGKSTLAAAFLRAGYRVLADDLLVMRREGGLFYGFPGLQRLKVLPEVAQSLCPTLVPVATLNPLTKKLIVRLDGRSWHSTPVPVRRFFVLGADEPSCRIEPLTGAAAIVELIRATFNDRIVDGARLQRQLMTVRAWLARIPAARLVYPRRFSAVDEVVAVVRASLDAPACVVA